ncbi:MAG: hypothetical protein OMM_05456 [Candidatus Magnetoglobus multicellularis str. Araruama]|uniref:Cadherin domain-containing protein n=1 Tax=Candidatus Magnetoglobus multicellularis str. Araruama TaxID=890399 RepID=A0A1V1NWB2_9BACT|nr:MAG: hypothetical protein OMM_05456 [Candidatus Magnetoglobus multicellularis str. Araruama]
MTHISTGPNESNQTWEFYLTPGQSSLFETGPDISENGQLTFKPAANAFGSTRVEIMLKDDGGRDHNGQNYCSGTIDIQILPVNDPPQLINFKNIELKEDERFTPIKLDCFSGPENEIYTQDIVKHVVNVSKPEMFKQIPEISNDMLTFTLTPDAYGQSDITILLKDNGGTDNGGTDTYLSDVYTISITPVNDPPTLDDIADPPVNSHSDIVLTGIGTGADNEDQQLFISAIFLTSRPDS